MSEKTYLEGYPDIDELEMSNISEGVGELEDTKNSVDNILPTKDTSKIAREKKSDNARKRRKETKETIASQARKADIENQKHRGKTSKKQKRILFKKF